MGSTRGPLNYVGLLFNNSAVLEETLFVWKTNNFYLI